MTIALWTLAVLLIVVGVAGTVLPALPGPPLVLAGVTLAAWIDDFTRIPPWVPWTLAGLTVLAFAVEHLAALAGARKVGASKLAIIGAAIGTIVGIFTGLIGLLFMPLVGAAIGEYITLRDVQRAGTVGLATWLGLLAGTLAKIVIVFVMLGLFLYETFF